jgi:hypothetical protein
MSLAELPHEAHLRYDAVPSFPTRSDFEHAEKLVRTETHPAAIWHREAVRWRMSNEGKPLDMVAIADAVLRALHS